ncbi:MAG: helix-turn-helix domain-containing protein [Thermoproteota archaeon]
MLNEVISKHVDKRLLRYLYETGKDKRLVEETHEEIARKIGTARGVVTRLLKRLEVEGLVEINRGQIRIKNFDTLKKEMSL